MTKTKMIGVLATVALVLAAGGAAAKGRLARAAIGGVVGSKSHHAVAGAVVGGAVGHHMAKTRAKKQAKAAAK